ncbi:MAG: right-handed parallel beta-helix repeat-containing protein [Terracidiphilus sp.]
MHAQAAATSQTFHIDCSAAVNGDGSIQHPWNNLAAAEAHEFAPGDTIAIARATVCNGAFAPRGSGTDGHIIRLTAYGVGPRPKIVAPATARQALLLFNQQYWQVDSLDISGGNKYGVFVSGDTGTLHHLYLKNLYVHDVYGGELKNKDNGLVIVDPGSINVFFDDVLIDGVDAAHTNQWAGILVGGGGFPYKDDSPLNTNIQIRNSTAHDVYGDGIVLFRDSHSSIRTSAAWEIGMQPTQDVGTPDAIWVWTCNDCLVADNEAYVTDSPGVDGGAYDIDWDNQHDTIERNYAHDTQGYCISVFGAGYVTSYSIVRDNLCIDNGLSPRMAVLQGAIYLSTWNGGTIRGLTISGNEIHWNPTVPGVAAIEGPGDSGGTPIVFTGNTVVSTSPLIYRISTPWQSSGNKYAVDGQPLFSIGEKKDLTLDALQAQGMESGSTAAQAGEEKNQDSIRLEAWINPALDEDGLLSDDARAELLVLRSLAGQYSPKQLKFTVHLTADANQAGENALRDLNDVYPDSLNIEHGSAPTQVGGAIGQIRLESADGRTLQTWRGFQNAATLGGAVRKLLGPPDYSHMQPLEHHEGHP